MHSRLIQLLIGFSGLLFSGMAHAHAGHGTGFLSGFAHPLLGLDHILAMLAVGIWAAQLNGRAIWAAPVSFVVVMVLAAGVALSGVALPGMESGIATTVLLLGLLLVFSIKANPVFAALAAGSFAFFHGFAHGMEIPAGESYLGFGAGFVFSTVLLHVAGLMAGKRFRHQQIGLRTLGCFVFASGAFMLGAA